VPSRGKQHSRHSLGPTIIIAGTASAASPAQHRWSNNTSGTASDGPDRSLLGSTGSTSREHQLRCYKSRAATFVARRSIVTSPDASCVPAQQHQNIGIRDPSGLLHYNESNQSITRSRSIHGGDASRTPTLFHTAVPGQARGTRPPSPPGSRTRRGHGFPWTELAFTTGPRNSVLGRFGRPK